MTVNFVPTLCNSYKLSAILLVSVLYSYSMQSAESVIEMEHNLAFFDQFSAVIVTELSERFVVNLKYTT